MSLRPARVGPLGAEAGAGAVAGNDGDRLRKVLEIGASMSRAKRDVLDDKRNIPAGPPMARVQWCHDDLARKLETYIQMYQRVEGAVEYGEALSYGAIAEVCAAEYALFLAHNALDKEAKDSRADRTLTIKHAVIGVTTINDSLALAKEWLQTELIHSKLRDDEQRRWQREIRAVVEATQVFELKVPVGNLVD